MLRGHGRWTGAALLVTSLLAAPGGATARPGDESGARADSLYRCALGRFAENSPDSRHSALADFEEASRLAPDRPDIWLAFGKACLESGRFETGRSCLSHAVRLLPANFSAWFPLGQAWKRDWLASLDRFSLDEALKCYRRAGAAAPDRPEAWSGVAALELLQGRPRDALAAALRARQAAPDAAEPLLMLGAAFYRLSVLAYADSAFRAARERLSPALRRRFDADLATAGARSSAGPDTASRSARKEEASPWRDADPDLTTPENEAQLDYLTRFALALFLFREGDEVRWDMRAEIFLRYGPPASVEYDPAWAQLGDKELEFHYPRHAYMQDALDPMPYPYNMQVWHYPDLGMDVTLLDRFLIQSYELPYVNDRSLDPRPDPEVLATQPDLVGMQGGRGVFRAMAPGAKPMVVTGAVSRFPLSDGVRVLAHVFAAGEPADSLWGSWALVGEDGRVMARESHALTISACDPTRRQVADFAANVPPGDYRLDLAVRGTGGRRGVAHLHTHLDPVPARLTMSDLILLCGDWPATFGPGGVRVEPNRDGHVSGWTTVTVYYELEHLATRADGSGRLAYAYSIHLPQERVEGKPEPAAVFEATREEENVGTHRRQFVSVPVERLAPGAYELRIQVRDLVGGETVKSALRFVKD